MILSSFYPVTLLISFSLYSSLWLSYDIWFFRFFSIYESWFSWFLFFYNYCFSILSSSFNAWIYISFSFSFDWYVNNYYSNYSTLLLNLLFYSVSIVFYAFEIPLLLFYLFSLNLAISLLLFNNCSLTYLS